MSYHYPTDGAVGGLRWAGLAKHLSHRGWETWVITAAPPPPEPGSTTIVSVRPYKTLRERVVEMRRGFNPPSEVATAVVAPPGSRPDRAGATLRGIGRELGFLLSVPDEARGWILPAAARIRSVLRAVTPHALVSSGPPHSAHLAAFLASRLSRVHWLVDLRDPWAGPIAEAWKQWPRFQSPVFLRLNKVFEQVVLRSAAGVVSNTRRLQNALMSTYPDVRVHWVPNGCDVERLPKTDLAPFPGMALAYVGTVYGGRDLTPVLHGLRTFLDRCPEAAADARLRVAGEVEPERLKDARERAVALGLGERVEFLGQLPQAEALAILGRSRVAIVLAQQQQWQVPAKLYELAALRLPTLVLAEHDSASGEEAERLGAVVVPGDDVERIATFLRAVWQGSQERPPARAMLDYADLAIRIEEILQP